MLGRILEWTLAICLGVFVIGFFVFVMYQDDEANKKAIKLCHDLKVGSSLDAASKLALQRGTAFRQRGPDEYWAPFSGNSTYEAVCEVRFDAGGLKSTQIGVFKSGVPRNL